jgi:putative transposase
VAPIKPVFSAVNFLLILCYLLGSPLIKIIVRQIKYLNNIVEQDHRSIKRITNPMLGFKTLNSAEATLAGIELHHMLRKNQHINTANQSIFSQFYALAG